MKNSWKWALLIAPLSVHAANEIPFNTQQMQTLGVTVVALATASPTMSNQLPGEIVIPVGQERIVSASQSGLIDAVHVAAGQRVKRGQILAHITSPDLVAMQRDYLQAQTQAKLAKNMLDRDSELYKEGIIAERRLLNTQSTHEELTITLAQRRQQLKLAGVGDSSLRQLEGGSGFSGGLTIASPIDGVVIEQMATAGQRVDPSIPIYRIASLKPLWIEIHAPLDILSFAKEGMRLTVPKYQAGGKIINIVRSVNKNDQTVHLRAEIETGADRLSPGQYVEAELIAEAADHQFSVPKTAVIRRGQNSYMFVQTSKGFDALPVTVINEQAEHAIVTGRLTGKEKIAVTGTAAIKAAWIGVSE